MDTKGYNAYWHEMKNNAADELAAVTSKDIPETECDVKSLIACALEHGTFKETADVMYEAMEWCCANLMLKKHEWVNAVLNDETSSPARLAV